MLFMDPKRDAGPDPARSPRSQPQQYFTPVALDATSRIKPRTASVCHFLYKFTAQLS